LIENNLSKVAINPHSEFIVWQDSPKEIIAIIAREIIQTKSKLMFSECSKYCYAVIFDSNPALVMIRDLIKTISKEYVYLEEANYKDYWQQLFYKGPLINHYLVIPKCDKNDVLKRYEITPIDYFSEYSDFFNEDLIKLINSKKCSCRNKLLLELFIDLPNYVKNINGSLVEITVQKKSQKKFAIKEITNTEFGQYGSAIICYKIFKTFINWDFFEACRTLNDLKEIKENEIVFKLT